MKGLPLFLLLVGVLYPPRIAYAEGSVSLIQASADSEHIEAQAAVRGAATPPVLAVVGEKSALTTLVHDASLDLWILVDTSSQCAARQVDTQVVSWLRALRTLPGASRVSVIAFHRGALEVLANRLAPSALQGISLRCTRGTFSAEADKAVAYALEASSVGVPKVVWLVSSGNTALTTRSLAGLKRENAALSVFLYQPALAATLQTLWDSQREALGQELFYAGSLNAEESLPEHRYSLSTELPSGAASPLALQARVTAGDKTLRSNGLSVTFAAPSGWTAGQWIRILGLASLLVLGVYGKVRLVRFYRARPCPECARLLRAGETRCAHCTSREAAYLVQENPLGAEVCPTRPLMVAIHSGLSVGSHRRSKLRCLRRQREKRRAYFVIHQEADSRFRLVPSGAVAVAVNRRPLEGFRYLAPGDRIQAGDSFFEFVYEK